MAPIAAEPEAQLTIPVHDLLVGLAAEHALGDLVLIREAQLLHVRPDFAALVGERACGWVELKAPGHSLDGPKWVGREKKQWSELSELDSLIVTNGEGARLYQSGEAVATASLPVTDSDWDSDPLLDLLRLFFAARPRAVTRVSQLANQLAPLARMLRERILAGLDPATARATIADAHSAWRQSVHEGATAQQFADDLAQVVAYSLAIAGLRRAGDEGDDGYVSLADAQKALRGPNEVLAAALSPILTIKGLMEDIRPEVGAIERLVSAVDVFKIRSSKDPRGEPWLWFYEDFLAKYDPRARKETGVYYTPTQVVDYQVRNVDYVLKQVFGRELGFGDPGVVTLDPASGSGTYPLSVLDKAAETATELRGPAGPAQVSKALAHNIFAFEILAGPYAVSHLRIGQRLADMAGTTSPPADVQVYLTDTLDDPNAGEAVLGLWGDHATLAQERERARAIKRDQPVTAVLGNPPYRRRTAKSGGGWVVHRANGTPIFNELLDAASTARVNFSATASLYNDYVYFWRWALWKVFETDADAPGVVSFITGSSWLTGPALLGLRRLATELADEIWILDLGGDGHAAIADENIFAVQTPVAVVTLFRAGASKSTPATVRYQRLGGTSSQKLGALSSVGFPGTGADSAWVTVERQSGDPLVPVSGDETWVSMPLVTDLFPWQQPGCKFGRTWPIAPAPELLQKRWGALLEATESKERNRRFAAGAHGRDIDTKVAGLPALASLQPGTPSQPIVRYGFRSFDLQWAFDDPRLARTESPSLWRSVSSKQVFFSSILTNQIGSGPALTATAAVPDLHHFSGRGGKDVIPLYRDAHGTANVTAGLCEKLSREFDRKVTAEDIAAYVYALLAHPGYQARFEAELRTPGLRVPLTASSILFEEAAAIGSELLYLHTYGERFHSPSRPASKVPVVASIVWTAAVQRLPESDKEVTYDASSEAIRIGDGMLSGVKPAVWNYAVSGFRVLPSWLGSRTRVGIGRAARDRTAKPLDLIRPTQWEDAWNSELLRLVRVLSISIDRQPTQATLLDKILASTLISASELPQPAPLERRAPQS